MLENALLFIPIYIGFRIDGGINTRGASEAGDAWRL